MNEYYYEHQGQQAGPVAADQLITHGVNANSLVWHDGMSNWAPAATVPELLSFFLYIPPPLPAKIVPVAPSLPLFTAASPTNTVTDAISIPPQINQDEPIIIPQFSAAKNVTKWWHIVLYMIFVLFTIFFLRVCIKIGFYVLEKALSHVKTEMPSKDVGNRAVS